MIVEKFQTQNNLTESTHFGKSHLSIQISLDGFIFCIFDKNLVDVVFLKEFEFTERVQNPEQLLNYVKEIYEKETVLKEKFESVNISHQNNLAVLVPETLYDADYQADYLKYSVKVLNDDSIAVDDIEHYETKNVYIPFSLVNNFMKEIYGDFDSLHTSTVLLNSLLKYFKNTIKKYFFVNVSKHSLELVYMQNGEIQLFNSFLYYTKEDFIYYILFAMEQLGLDPDSQSVTFIGDIEKESTLYAITYQYVRHVNFLNINNFSLSDDFYQINKDLSRHQYFELLNQF
jgi:hypothetical protein